MEELLNRDFDDELRKKKDVGLAWLPWVGVKYRALGDLRLLVVGESHYCSRGNGDRDSYKWEGSTRDDIGSFGLCTHRGIKTYANLARTFCGKHDCGEYDIDTRRYFWAAIAYYNFIQDVMMNDADTGPDRPTPKQFRDSWSVFIEVVKILRPTHCIFIGVAASNSFDDAMGKMGFVCTAVQRRERIGNTYGRTTSFDLDGQPIQMVSIQHAGSMFSWSSWRRFLFDHAGVVMKTLNEKYKPDA
jgi:hypothetical protein